MKVRYTVVFISFLLVSGAIANAQTGVIRGKVTDSSSGQMIEYAHILNYSNKQQIYSNSKGEFKLDAQKGDTVIMYAMGYYYEKFIVDDAMTGKEQYSFSLREQPYVLKEARIPAFATYDAFKRAFIALEDIETPIDKLNNSLASGISNAAREGYAEAMAKRYLQGVSLYSTPILTRDEKERIKLAKIIDKEQVHNQIYQKFNPHVVKQVTGLTEDDDIIEFMVFCKFPEEYLLEVSEYDLASRISLKYEMFKKKKQDEKSIENPLNFLNEPYNHLS